MLTLTVKFGYTATVIVLDTAGFIVGQATLEVIKQLTASELDNVEL
jgi:hypothetical protein